MRVLVGYATAHGSTREIAEHLGARLARHGLDVEVAELGLVAAPETFDAYVLASAVHGQRWLPEARAFVAEHAPELAAKPVWLLSVGMPDALRSPLPALAHLFQPPVLVSEFASRVSIRDHLVVSGVIRAEHLPLIGWLAMLLLTRGAGDYRDWDRLDAWADGIARVLTTLPAPRRPPARRGPAPSRP
ncbi:flavodoxin domain-containing protein [Actinomycetospora cinnamomea]|uniref:Menaquinone-dependent protoporphyrinogen oxidase n=1 Tax=Actinomycetospora cinnamomea TaxID=663609 RepID=A0A2U1F2H6_9PSEU|nr:flavodoxin domain-containing protein [Actinomycetospora cinnamomea]PVZ06368.1 menaquinone-dependent protoporphyrinogen oxidase [Actinomycetospora cinnamomea]